MLEEKTCCFVSCKTVLDTPLLRKNIQSAITNLIHKRNVRTFLFGANGKFESICLEIIYMLKLAYPFLVAVQIQPLGAKCIAPNTNYAYDKKLTPQILRYPNELSTTELNELLIDSSDFAIFYKKDTPIKKTDCRSTFSRSYSYALNCTCSQNKRLEKIYVCSSIDPVDI